MIPIELTIEGFLSYQNAVTIHFDPFQLACISGPNGAGKSSILDAITWSLFGIARSRNDAVVNQDSEAAQVSFHFQYENQEYKIRRYKAKEKVQVLEALKFDEENKKWRSLTESTIHQTQNRINAILRLDYDSFVHAAFFLQGKADMFTNLTPSRRKEILASILGLEIWESYREAVNVELRQLEIKEKQISAILNEIEAELETEASVKAALTALEQDEDRKQKIKQDLTQLFEHARQMAQNAHNSAEQIKLFESDLKKREQNLSQKEMRFNQINSQLGSLAQRIKDSELIEKDYQRWKSLRIELDDLEDKRDRFVLLENERNLISHNIEVEKTSLETQLAGLQKESASIEIHRKNSVQIQAELSSLEAQIFALETNQVDREFLQSDLDKNQQELTRTTSRKDQLTELNNQLRKDFFEFQHAGPECPFCKQPLTPAHRETYESKMKAEGINRNLEIERLKEAEQKYIKKIEERKAALVVQNKIENDKLSLGLKKTQLLEKKNQIDTILADWNENKQPALLKLEKTLQTESFSESEREKLRNLFSEMEKVHYDANKHQQAKIEETSLRDISNQMSELQNAQAMFDPLKQQVEELSQEILELTSEIEGKQTSLTELRDRHSQQFSTIPDLVALQNDLNEVQIQLNRMLTLIGGEKQKLAAIEMKKKASLTYQEEKATLRLAMSRFQKLKEAFGKNGIPAWLIENALPQIEDQANLLLDRLTHGEMTVRFETQGEYKDKKRSDKKETLEILINDVNGNTRAYEMFSGGEAFRINFAIRMALSRVLAHRSGAKLQTLVIDEGFGSQDVEGRQRVIEAINHVRSDFAKILIITHLEELKDAFPARIEVEKTNQGSTIQVQVF